MLLLRVPLRDLDEVIGMEPCAMRVGVRDCRTSMQLPSRIDRHAQAVSHHLQRFGWLTALAEDALVNDDAGVKMWAGVGHWTCGDHVAPSERHRTGFDLEGI